MKFQKRLSHGFTLVELLVVITIIGILIALLLPAVQAAREAARRLQCQNNLKQLSLGCMNHEQLHKFLPSGGWGFWWTGDPDRGVGSAQPGGWSFSILPFIEQQGIHDLGSDGQPETITTTQRNGAVQRDQTPLTIFICPTRRSAMIYPRPRDVVYYNSSPLGHRGVGIDYAANCGDDQTYRMCPGPGSIAAAETYNWAGCGATTSTGAIFTRSEIRMADITDGASNTIMLGEKSIDVDYYETGEDNTDDGGPYEGQGHDLVRWTSTWLPLGQDPLGTMYWDSFGSAHSTGCHFAFCDGSVQMLNYSIDRIVYSRLGNRKDGKAIDAKQY